MTWYTLVATQAPHRFLYAKRIEIPEWQLELLDDDWTEEIITQNKGRYLRKRCVKILSCHQLYKQYLTKKKHTLQDIKEAVKDLERDFPWLSIEYTYSGYVASFFEEAIEESNVIKKELGIDEEDWDIYTDSIWNSDDSVNIINVEFYLKLQEQWEI